MNVSLNELYPFKNTTILFPILCCTSKYTFCLYISSWKKISHYFKIKTHQIKFTLYTFCERTKWTLVIPFYFFECFYYYFFVYLQIAYLKIQYFTDSYLGRFSYSIWQNNDVDGNEENRNNFIQTAVCILFSNRSLSYLDCELQFSSFVSVDVPKSIMANQLYTRVIITLNHTSLYIKNIAE